MSKCLVCETTENKKSTTNKFICEECAKKISFAHKMLMIDKAEKMTSKSLRRWAEPEEYEKAIAVITEKVKNNEYNFGSAYEVAVAIQLTIQKIDFVTQYKIGKNVVDIYLPDMNVVLEIDGSIYHSDYDKDFIRDRNIRFYNNFVEILHISTDNIPLETWNLKEAIPYVISKREFDKRFGQPEYDEVYLAEFKAFERYIRGGKIE